MFSRNPAASTVVFVTIDWTGIFGSGSQSGDLGTASDEMAGMCVNISTEVRDCVRPVDLLFDLLRVASIQFGQQYPLHLWFICFCEVPVFLMHLGDPVAVKTVGNKRNNTLCYGWLSCWDKLNLSVMNRYGTMGQCSGALGGYIPPDRATLLFRSDHAEIKGFWDCTVVGCFVQVVPLLRFGARVAGRGVAASAGVVIHVTVLSYLDGGLLGRSDGCNKCRSGRGFGPLQ